MIASRENMELLAREEIVAIAYSPTTGETYSARPGDLKDMPMNWVMRDEDGEDMILGRPVQVFLDAEDLL
jgi:hypothetical protein